MTTSGWGAGEWNDMAWGTGDDYPYAAYQFFAAQSTLEPSMASTGSLVAFAFTGPLQDYTATGVTEG